VENVLSAKEVEKIKWALFRLQGDFEKLQDSEAALSADFKEQIREQLQRLFHGKAHWTRGPRYGTLAEAVGQCSFGLASGRTVPCPKWSNEWIAERQRSAISLNRL